MSSPQGGGGPRATAAGFSKFGAGCPGTGWQTGLDIILPAAQAVAFGGSNNNIPLSWVPTRYQQVLLGSEVGPVTLLTGLSLRQDEQFANHQGQQINLEVSLGGTTFDHATLTNTFQANFNSGAMGRQVVFAQRDFCLPAMPSARPTNPAEMLFTIPFDVPVVVALGTNENLLVEMLNSGNSFNGSSFTYPLDAANGTTTARLWASPTSPTGTLGLNFGMVMGLRTIIAPTLPVPQLFHTTLPRLGQTFRFGLCQVALNAPLLLLLGSSNTTSGGIPLPFDLTPVGAPGCQLLVTATQIMLAMASGPGGDVAASLPIPTTSSLDGAVFYLQALVYDPSVNALGFVTSNGGMATIGF